MINKAVEYLKQYFHYDDFRLGQKLIIESILDRKDTVGIMPTGGGKSLCYQIPALCFDGVTIVISPLISLMKDQMDFLNSINYPAGMLNSTVDYSYQNDVKNRTENGSLKLLYLTPERFKNKNFYEWLLKQKISLFCIDEAHCISEWGHDFRPEYRKLSAIVKDLKNPPILALTATATEEVRNDIAKSLDIKKPNVFVSGFNRDNLIYGVQNHISYEEKNKALIEFVGKASSPGIIYVSSIKEGENLLNVLSSNVDKKLGIYHGSLAPKIRKKIQEDFLENKVDILIATNAFGMGVNKPDIRFVAHYNVPGTIEAYYQETGRAGRDGKTSYCLLLHLTDDERIQQFFIESKNPSFEDLATVLDNIIVNSKRKPLYTDDTAVLVGNSRLNSFKVEAALKQLHFLGYIDFEFIKEMKVNISILKDKSVDDEELSVFFEEIKNISRDKELNCFIEALYKRTGYMRDDIIDKLDALQKLKLIRYNKIKSGKVIKILKNKFTKADQSSYINKIKLKIEFDRAKFREVVKFCNISNDCRRKFLLNYFGEEYNEPNCGKCDVCRGTYFSNVENFSIELIHKKILYCAFLHDGEVGKQKIAKIMKGSYDLEPRYRDWDEFGILKDADIKKIANEINLLIKTEYLFLKQGKYPVITLSIKGMNVLKKESFKI